MSRPVHPAATAAMARVPQTPTRLYGSEFLQLSRGVISGLHSVRVRLLSSPRVIRAFHYRCVADTARNWEFVIFCVVRRILASVTRQCRHQSLSQSQLQCHCHADSRIKTSARVERGSCMSIFRMQKTTTMAACQVDSHTWHAVVQPSSISVASSCKNGFAGKQSSAVLAL